MRVEIGSNRGLWAAAAAATILSAGAPMMAPSLGSFGRSRYRDEPPKTLRHIAIAKAKKKAAHKNARKARRRNQK